MTKTAIRFRPIRSTSALAAATCHARRQDATGKARVRPGAVMGHALSWTAYDVADRDELAAFKAHKSATGATERAGAPLGLHAICVIGPAWIESSGDLHDEANDRNIALFNEARAWAESWAGSGSVITARLDLDERGGGVVDLTIVPVRMQRSRGGRETLRISTNAALQALCDETGETMSFSAAQTSWWTWCQRTLDPNVERGVSRKLTGAEHLRPEEYGRIADELRALREQMTALEVERNQMTVVLEDARAAVVAAVAEQDEARITAQWLMERAKESARMTLDLAERQAREITAEALQKAQALEAKGRLWAADVKARVTEQNEAKCDLIRTEIMVEAQQLRADAVDAAEEAGKVRLKQILLPTRSIAGIVGLIKTQTEAERAAELAVITKEIQQDEIGVREVYKAAKVAAEERAAKAESRTKELTRLLSERTMERDRAQTRLWALERLRPNQIGFAHHPRGEK